VFLHLRDPSNLRALALGEVAVVSYFVVPYREKTKAVRLEVVDAPAYAKLVLENQGRTLSVQDAAIELGPLRAIPLNPPTGGKEALTPPPAVVSPPERTSSTEDGRRHDPESRGVTVVRSLTDVFEAAASPEGPYSGVVVSFSGRHPLYGLVRRGRRVLFIRDGDGVHVFALADRRDLGLAVGDRVTFSVIKAHDDHFRLMAVDVVRVSRAAVAYEWTPVETLDAAAESSGADTG
jgi:hypothetical protein